MNKTAISAALAALLTGGALAAAPSVASAYVVCGAGGDCWHTDRHYDYQPGFQVRIHPDSWYFHRAWDHDRDYRWRSHHDGRGYYRNGVWITF